VQCIRAGIAQTPESSEFTSIYERIQYIKKQKKCKANKYDALKQPKSLVSFNNGLENKKHCIDFCLSDYLALVDYTGRTIRDDKKSGSIPSHLVSILSRLQFEPNRWVSFVENLESKFAYAVGSEILLLNFSKKRSGGLKGILHAKKVYPKPLAA